MARTANPNSRTIPVTVKVSRTELRALRELARGHSKPSAGLGLRKLIDRFTRGEA